MSKYTLSDVNPTNILKGTIMLSENFTNQLIRIELRTQLDEIIHVFCILIL